MNIVNSHSNIDFKKIFKIFFICLLTFTCFISIFSVTTYATDEPPEGMVFEENMFEGEKWLKDLAWSMVYRVYSNQELDKVIDKVAFDPENESASDAVVNVWDFVGKIYEAMVSVAYGLIVLYFLLDVIEKTTHEQMSIEHFFRSTIKLIVAVVFINSGMDLLRLGVQFTTALGDMLSAVVQDSEETTFRAILWEYHQKIDGKDGLGTFISNMGIVLQMIIPWLANIAANVIIELVVWSRMIEIGLRGAFAPIGMADMFTEGTKGAGFRYFKKFLAVGLQGALIIGVMACYNFIAAGVLSEPSDSAIAVMISQLVLTFSTVSLLLKTQTLSNDIIGV